MVRHCLCLVSPLRAWLRQWLCPAVPGGAGTTSLRSDRAMHLREWTHLACTWDATSGVKIYINGQVREHLSSTFPCVTLVLRHCLSALPKNGAPFSARHGRRQRHPSATRCEGHCLCCASNAFLLQDSALPCGLFQARRTRARTSGKSRAMSGVSMATSVMSGSLTASSTLAKSR